MNRWLAAMDWIDRIAYPVELWLWIGVLLVAVGVEHLIERRRP